MTLTHFVYCFEFYFECNRMHSLFLGCAWWMVGKAQSVLTVALSHFHIGQRQKWIIFCAANLSVNNCNMVLLVNSSVVWLTWTENRRKSDLFNWEYLGCCPFGGKFSTVCWSCILQNLLASMTHVSIANLLTSYWKLFHLFKILSGFFSTIMNVIATYDVVNFKHFDDRVCVSLSIFFGRVYLRCF